jgi:signal transduction histidine kinase
MKRYVIPLVALLFLSSLFFAEDETSAWEAKEMRLKKAEGKERLELLVELTRHYRGKDHQKTITYGEEALELLRRFPGPEMELKLLDDLCNTHIALNKFGKARELAERAREMAEKSGLRAHVARALFNLGWMYRRQHQYPESLKYLQQAAFIYRELGDPVGAGKSALEIGRCYDLTNDNGKAIEYYLGGIKKLEESENESDIAAAYQRLATIYLVTSQHQNAMQYLKRTLDIYRKHGQKTEQGKILHNIAYTYMLMGDFKSGLDYAQKAIQTGKEMNEPRRVSISMALIGVIYIEVADYPKAMSTLEQALELATSLKDRDYIAGVLWKMGVVKNKTRAYREAIPLLKRAFPMAQTIDAKNTQKEAAKELTMAYEAIGDLKNALLFQKKYQQIHDTIFNETQSKKISTLQAKYELETKDKEIKLLTQEKRIQQLNLDRQKNFKNFLLFLSLLALVLAFMIFLGYRSKTKHARALAREMEERKNAEAQLIRSRKMEAVGILAGGIAHDFNNLLAIITGYIDMIKDDSQPGSGQFKMLGKVEQTLAQAVGLADKFIAFSKSGWMVPEKTPFKDIINTTIQRYPELRPLLERAVIAEDGQPIYIYADVRRMAEVMYNLVKNALDSGSPPEHITITAEPALLEPGNPGELEPGEYLKVSVSDKGEGIPPELQGKIFEPYFSTKANVTQKGLGLGLAICYSVVLKHGGTFLVESEPGRSTTLSFYLPAFEPET